MDQILYYCGHEFFKSKDEQRYGGFIWRCKNCKHKSAFIQLLMERNIEVLSCNERLIKDIIE